MTIYQMVDTLTTSIRQRMYDSPLFPYDKTTPEDKRRFPRHMKDVALKQNVTYMLSPELQYFEMGNPSAEQNTPHYHILEDAKIIRMPYKGTKKSKGSQRLIGRKSQRDYGQITFKPSKTGGFQAVQEYRQNMTRNYDGMIGSKTQPREFSKRQKVSDINKRNYRYNIHYQYIEKTLQAIVPDLARDIGAIKVKVGSYESLEDGLGGTQKIVGSLDKNFELVPGLVPDFNFKGIR
jgi:hypothetical protein